MFSSTLMHICKRFEFELITKLWTYSHNLLDVPRTHLSRIVTNSTRLWWIYTHLSHLWKFVLIHHSRGVLSLTYVKISYQFFTSVIIWYRFFTSVRIWYWFFTCARIWYRFFTCEDLVPILHIWRIRTNSSHLRKIRTSLSQMCYIEFFTGVKKAYA